MSNLTDTLAKLRNHQITGEQTTVIDQTLSRANADDISDDDATNVISYIDSELLHNGIEVDIENRLTALRASLELRR